MGFSAGHESEAKEKTEALRARCQACCESFLKMNKQYHHVSLCAIHSSGFAIAMANRRRFQSLLPGYRTQGSQNVQMANESQSGSSFR